MREWMGHQPGSPGPGSTGHPPLARLWLVNFMYIKHPLIFQLPCLFFLHQIRWLHSLKLDLFFFAWSLFKLNWFVQHFFDSIGFVVLILYFSFSFKRLQPIPPGQGTSDWSLGRPLCTPFWDLLGSKWGFGRFKRALPRPQSLVLWPGGMGPSLFVDLSPDVLVWHLIF